MCEAKVVDFLRVNLVLSLMEPNILEAPMTIREFLLAELDREVERSRRALAEAPKGKYDWKPHEKSMIFGYLANMVATIPTWVAMEINQDELDVAPANGGQIKQERLDGSEDLLKALDKSAESARSAFQSTSDAHLKTEWKLLARGNVVMRAPRHEFISDTLSHWSHHRGQMTVYLRLLGQKVPAIFGPSADDNQFR
jgi:uncharacterized damage-inducible protein DinB